MEVHSRGTIRILSPLAAGGKLTSLGWRLLRFDRWDETPLTAQTTAPHLWSVYIFQRQRYTTGLAVESAHLKSEHLNVSPHDG
jgi:hypothetical protein